MTDAIEHVKTEESAPCGNTERIDEMIRRLRERLEILEAYRESHPM